MTNNENKYFYGNKISEYGVENGYVDYACLASCFNHVLNNDIIPSTSEKGFYWELVSGYDYNEKEDYYIDIFQYYIVDYNGYKTLQENDEIVYYCDDLDMYVWGVTHYGTIWDYVLTDIEIDW